MKELFFTKFALAVVIASIALGVASCSSDEPAAPDYNDENTLGADKSGRIFLYKGHKVKANTNFTMEEFSAELFSHPTWEDATIADCANGKWRNNLNAEPGKDGWTLQSCYEFQKDGYAHVFDRLRYKYALSWDTVYYSKERFSINVDEKSFTFTRNAAQVDNVDPVTGDIEVSEFEASFVYKIVAVDKGRIVFDYASPEGGYVTRYSIEPYDGDTQGIKAEHR